MKRLPKKLAATEARATSCPNFRTFTNIISIEKTIYIHTRQKSVTRKVATL